MEPRWYTLWIMFVVQVIGSLSFLMLTILTPFIKGDFGVSTSDIGILVTCLYAGYFCSVTTGGIITDQAGVQIALWIGFGAMGTIVLLSSLLPTFWSLVVGAYVVGFGYGTVPSATNKGIFEWFPAGQVTVGVSIKQTGVMLGGAVGAAVLPTLTTEVGWRGTLRVIGLIAWLTMFVIYRYTPKSERTGPILPSAGRIVEKHRQIARVATRKDVFPLLASGVLFGAAQFTLMGYIILYLTESILLAPAIAGLVYTGMQLIGMGSRVGFGVVTDYFVNSKHLVLGLIGLGGFIFYLPLLFLSPETNIVVTVGVLLCVGGITLGYNGVYLTIAGEMTDTDEIGIGTAVGVAAVMLGGVLAPPIVGFLIDTLDGYRIPMASLGLITMVAGIAAVCSAAADRPTTAPAD